MILYVAYLVLLALFFLGASVYFDFAFKAAGVGLGMKTVAIQIATLIVVALIMKSRPNGKVVWPEILTVGATWAPLLLYIAFRVDIGHPYSELKFAKIAIVSFLCVVTVTATYLSDSRTFLRLFPVVVIVLSVLLGLEMFTNPEVFRYRTVIERATIEGMNPIWLARGFATAGLCFLLLPGQLNIAKLIGLASAAAAIIPTGSRGPLISLVVTLSIWLMIQSMKSGFRAVTTIVSAVILSTSIFLLVGDRLDPVVSAYLSRGGDVGLIEESGRPQLFNQAMLDFYSSPVFGVGLGAFGESSAGSAQGYSDELSQQGHYPHNIALEILSELGTIGVILFAIAMRPGKWLLGIRNPYFYLFLLAFLFSMSSGDINSNVGVIIFGTLARLTFKYPSMNDTSISPTSPAVEMVK